MKESYNYILSNLVFITRIPVRLKFEYKSDKGNVRFFPLIGIILGVIMGSIALVSQRLFGSLPAATLSVLSMIILTGGIHLDGLSDMADGLLSYKDRDTVIEIMKDSRIGAMGVIALVSLIILKIVFVNLLISSNLLQFVFFYPVVGRLAIVNACYFGRPIAKSRLGAGFIGNIKTLEFLLIQASYLIFMVIINLALTGADSFLLASIPLVIALAVNLFFSKKLVKNVTDAIGGISGDILGGACELAEALSLPLFFLGVKICEGLI